MKKDSLQRTPMSAFDRGKKNKATRQAITMGGTPKNRTKAKAQPRLKGYKKRKK